MFANERDIIDIAEAAKQDPEALERAVNSIKLEEGRDIMSYWTTAAEQLARIAVKQPRLHDGPSEETLTENIRQAADILEESQYTRVGIQIDGDRTIVHLTTAGNRHRTHECAVNATSNMLKTIRLAEHIDTTNSVGTSENIALAAVQPKGNRTLYEENYGVAARIVSPDPTRRNYLENPVIRGQDRPTGGAFRATPTGSDRNPTKR